MAYDFNKEPYYDDFDEKNQYYRILFKPGYAVQARELTQLQTALQDQIKKFGTNIFVDGTTIIGGEKAFETSLIALRINLSINSVPLTADDVNSFNNTIITGATSGVTGVVKQVIFGTDYHTLVVKVTSGDAFSAAENISNNALVVKTATIASANHYNNCTLFSVKTGVFFVNGAFVYSPAQSILVDQLVSVPDGSFVPGTLYRISKLGTTSWSTLGVPSGQTPAVGTTFVANGAGNSNNTGTVLNVSSKNIGFVVNESTVSSEEDDNLLDNAQGSFNYSAPGADRWKIELQLTVKGLTESVDNFIELARVEYDQYIITAPNTVYNTLGKELARRTFDQAGNYTVSNFPLILKDNIGGDANKFTAALDPGKAYISGFEFETKTQSYLTLDRARTTQVETNPAVSPVYGNYVNVSGVTGEIVTTNNAATGSYSTVELHSVLKSSVSGTTYRIGTAQVRYLKYSSGTVGGTYTPPTVTSGILTSAGNTAAVYIMYLFNVKMDSGQVFASTKSIVVRTGTLFSADIDPTSSVAGIGTVLGGSDKTGLVFPLNRDFISKVKDGSNLSQTNYYFQRTYQNQTVQSNGTIILNTASGSERWDGGNTTYSTQKVKTSYHVVVTTGSGSFTVGQVIDMTASGRSISGGTITPNAQQALTLNITGTGSSAAGVIVTIIATIIGSNQPERTKTLSGYQLVVVSSSASGLGTRYSLNKADGYDLLAVYNTGTNNASGVTVNSTTGVITWGAVTRTDVTRNYTFDNGQRDDIYDHASIVASSAPLQTANEYLVVVYRNFTHAGGGNNNTGFLSRDSYSIAYDNIPKFTSPTTGITYNLRDCLDFRPRRTDSATTLDYGQLPDPNSNVESTFQYYLGRKDVILAMPSKQFSVKTGTPSINPQTPVVDSDGMQLYILTIPPWTSDLNSVSVQYVDNRRYTMRDIGKIEKRVGNIEYYTQLSILEKQAKDDSVLGLVGTTTTQKFKNGIIVDPFSGHNIGDSTNPDYRCAIDLQRQEMRAFAETYSSEFSYTQTGQTTSTRSGDLVTLPYTESAFAIQPFATTSMNINPFNIISFVGNISLEPSQDLWVDTLTVPPLNITNDVSQTVNVFKPIQTRVVGGWWWGQNWGWNAGWGWGGWGSGWWGGWNGFGWGGWWGGWGSTSQSATTVTSTASTSLNTESLGTNVIDLQFLPFIRARTIFGKGSLLKPKTRHYPFLDEKSIGGQVRPLMQVYINNISGTFNDSVGVYDSLTFRTVSVSGTVQCTASTALYTPVTKATASNPDSTKQRIIYIYNASAAASIAVGQYVVGPNGSGIVTAVGYQGTNSGTYGLVPTVTTTYTYSTGGAIGATTMTLTGTYNGQNGYFISGVGVPIGTQITAGAGTTTITLSQPITIQATGNYSISNIPPVNTPLYTDEFGLVAFEFQIPGGTYRSGERKVRLIDNVDNNTTTSQSSGDATYFALGQIKTERETLLTTRTTTTTNTSQTTVTQFVGWGDPLAQSFLVDAMAYPNGLYLSSVDLYFRTKSVNNIPVTVELRKMINGYPESSSTITFGRTTLFPEKVNISETAATATNFKFSSPVYLPAGEYCFVVMSNCNEYEAFISVMGETIVGTNTRVTQQPYAGVMFKSQNGTTWNAMQEDDIKFSLNRCVFSYAGNAVFTVNDPPSYSTTGSISAGQYVISNVPAAAFNNIGIGMLVTGTGIPNGTTIAATGTGGVVTSYTIGAATGTIALSAAATATTSAFTLYGQYEFGTLNINSSIISPSGTNISLLAKTMNKSDGIYDSTGVAIVNKTDLDFSSIKKVIPVALTSGSNTPSLQISASLVTTSDAVSPAIDVGRFTSVMIKNVINNDITSEGATVGVSGTTLTITSPAIQGGNALCKYITKKVTLAAGFDSSNLVATMTVYKPYGTDIKVYYKTLPTEKTSPIDSESWIPMIPENNATVPYSTSTSDYKEHRFFPPTAYSANGVFNTPNNDPIPARFNNFQFKVVLTSINEAVTPRVRDFRGIALDQ